jgi:nitrogen regulatory protein P-II 1
MKEIKAYVRAERVDNVVRTLEQAGFCCMTIVNVSGLGGFSDPPKAKYSIEYVEKYSKVVKIELVCNDEQVDQAIDAFIEGGRTHKSGDGIVFVSPVERAVKIRTGDESTDILQK